MIVFFKFIFQRNLWWLSSCYLKKLKHSLWICWFFYFRFELYNKISYSWKQKLTPKSLENSKHYGKFLGDRQRQARSFSICTILPKSPKLITLSRNQNRNNRSTRKSSEWPRLRNVLKRHRYSILSNHSPNVPPFIPWISSQKERHSR